jgi:hypothetical protein
VATSGDQHADRDRPGPDEAAGDADDWRAAGEHPPLGASAEAAVAALFDAGPEAVEHLLKAAQELLLAAKAVVDAGERAVESHRSASDVTEPASGEDAPAGGGRVRRIDLA